MMKYLLSLLFIMHALECAEEDCPPNACEVRKYKCLSQESCNGTLVPKAAACGCCPGCKPYLKEGDDCVVKEPDSNSTSTTPSSGRVDLNTVKGECRPEGLTCLSGICVRIY